MTTTTHQTLDQQRAAFAWKCVKDGCSKEYVALASGASALVSSNGLLQALAYYYQKKGEARKLGSHIQSWLSERNKVPADFKGFVERILDPQFGSSEYLRLTEEALEFLKWLRQFAKANEKG